MFLSYYKMKYRFIFPDKVVAGAGPDELPEGDREPESEVDPLHVGSTEEEVEMTGGEPEGEPYVETEPATQEVCLFLISALNRHFADPQIIHS